MKEQRLRLSGSLKQVRDQIDGLILEHGEDVQMVLRSGQNILLLPETDHFVTADHPIAARVDEYNLSQPAAERRADALRNAGYENVEVGKK